MIDCLIGGAAIFLVAVTLPGTIELLLLSLGAVLFVIRGGKVKLEDPKNPS